ncbi:hypothetical protein BN946_scf184817.g17 [Trametes cinnabarina]|uniref:Uncharacterized protein n=1 Tax=Pycnoporus cinnabarinus TaxID=5643 RepID=A0A060S4S9_PYCCI|nr:hypothetical protein BN946_scf184817.g17 [Trametes cinnabarina]
MAAPTSDEYLRILSIAVFASLAPGSSTLSLFDPDTNQLCEFRLQKISGPLDTPSLDSSYGSTATSCASRSGTRSSSGSPFSNASLRKPRSASLDSRLRSDLLNRLLLTGSSVYRAPHLDKRTTYPIARLPPLSVRVRGDGTPPSFWDDSLSSETTALSLAPTPVKRLFRNPNVGNPNTPTSSSGGSSAAGSSQPVGLGFSDLFGQNGTPFDGLGSLPRQTSTPHRVCTSPADGPLLWTSAEGPSPSSEGSRGSLNASTSPGEFFREAARRALFSRKVDAVATPDASFIEMRSPPGAPAHRGTVWRPQSASLPARPAAEEDVFFSKPIRVPGSLAPQGAISRGSCRASRGYKAKDQLSRDGSDGSGVVGAWSVPSSPRGSMTAEWVALEKGRIGEERRPAWKP